MKKGKKKIKKNSSGSFLSTYRCPPRSRVVQATVVAVLQAAGVRHTARIINLEPVCVVGDSAAAKLHQRKTVNEETWLFIVITLKFVCMVSTLNILCSMYLAGRSKIYWTNKSHMLDVEHTSSP